MTNSNQSGETLNIPISRLRLDPQNPRLPRLYRGASQEDLAVALEIGFEAFAVAQSIARNGFFLAEPLLVISSETEDGAWTVVEGNRRLTALIGLTNKDIRDQFEESERWEQIANESAISLETKIPVVVHSTRDETYAQVAKAHVVGKLGWLPYSQASYIADRIEEGRTYAEVAEMIGIAKAKVATMYRDYCIVKSAQNMGLSTTEVEQTFSLLTVAMSSANLRDHVGAPPGSQYIPGTNPVPASKELELQELISWVFGDEDNEPKISDSRQISILGRVSATEVGLAALRSGESLEEAKQKIQSSGMPPRERLCNRLGAAQRALQAASEDFGEYVDDLEVKSLLADVEAELESLKNILATGDDEDSSLV